MNEAMQWGAIVINLIGSGIAIGSTALVKRAAVAKARRRAASDRNRAMASFEFRLAWLEEIQGASPRLAEGTNGEGREHARAV